MLEDNKRIKLRDKFKRNSGSMKLLSEKAGVNHTAVSNWFAGRIQSANIEAIALEMAKTMK